MDAAIAKNRIHLPHIISQYWLMFFTVLVAIGFGALENNFFRVTNLLNILTNACIYGIMGVGLTCIMSTGEMDFSTGGQVSLAAVLMAVTLDHPSINSYMVGILVTLLASVAIGLFNALLHIKVRMPAFIATQGTGFILRGLAKLVTGGVYLQNLRSWPKNYTFLGQGYLFGVIPMPVICLVTVSVFVLVVTERTRTGKYLYAVGSNARACDYLGISSKQQKLKGFLICSVLCGLAGIVLGSMLNGGGAGVADTYQVPAMTTVMLGATFYKRGVFNVPGTLVGAVLTAVITNGLVMVSVPSWMSEVVQGSLMMISIVVVTIMMTRNQPGK